MVQRTQRSDEVQHVDIGANRLLGLPGLAVRQVELRACGARVVHVVTDEEGAAACPSCGTVSSSLKGRAVTRPRDLPYGEAAVCLVWHKRRWRCRETACGRASFTESVVQVPARSRLTTRLRRACGAGIAEEFKDVQSAGAHFGMSWPTAHAAFVTHTTTALAAPLPPVCVLGIDETRRGKPKWAQDPVTGRWRVVADRWLTGIVDAHGTAGLLGHVEGRTSALVAAWLNAQPQDWRDQVTHVTIDLSASYLRAVTTALPHAVVVADRFHLIALANGMVTDVRQRATRDVRGRRGHKVDPEWANRRRLLTAHERLSDRSFVRMWNQLVDTGDPGLEVLMAYTVKENLRQLLALAGTHPDREVISHRLWRFYDQAAESRSPEVHRLAATVEAWWPAIEAAITTGYSNARSEGYNRLAKHQGRNAFGFRNTDNQRRRIRWACTRQHRRATARTTEMPG
jgi:transposase